MRFLTTAFLLGSLAIFSPSAHADDPLQLESWGAWKTFGLSKVSANGSEGQDRGEYEGGLFPRFLKTKKAKARDGALAKADTQSYCHINGTPHRDTGSTAEVHGTAKGSAQGVAGDSNNVQGVGKAQMTLTYTGEENGILSYAISVVRDTSDDDGNGVLNPTANGFGSIDVTRDGPGGLSRKLTLKPSKITWTENGAPKQTKAASKTITGTFDLKPGDSIFINSAAATKVNGVVSATLHTGVTVSIAIIDAPEEGELDDGPGGGSGDGSGGSGDGSGSGPGGPPPAISEPTGPTTAT